MSLSLAFHKQRRDAIVALTEKYGDEMQRRWGYSKPSEPGAPLFAVTFQKPEDAVRLVEDPSHQAIMVATEDLEIAHATWDKNLPQFATHGPSDERTAAVLQPIQ